MNFLQNLQNKPHKWKKKFAITLTGIIVFIIFAFWVGGILPKEIDKVTQNNSVASTSVIQDINEPLVLLGTKLADYVVELRDIFKKASPTASTTSSGTDLVQ